MKFKKKAILLSTISLSSMVLGSFSLLAKNKSQQTISSKLNQQVNLVDNQNQNKISYSIIEIDESNKDYFKDKLIIRLIFNTTKASKTEIFEQHLKIKTWIKNAKISGVDQYNEFDYLPFMDLIIFNNKLDLKQLESLSNSDFINQVIINKIKFILFNKKIDQKPMAVFGECKNLVLKNEWGFDQDVGEFCQIDSSSGTSFEPVYSKDLLELREEFIENVEDRLSDEFFADFYDNTNLFEQTPTPNDHLLIKTNPIKDDFESLLSKKSGLQYKIMRLVYQHEHGKVIKTLPVNALIFLNHEDLKFEELYSGNYRFTGIEYWDKENKIWVFEELINHNEQYYQMQVVFNNNITVHDLISKVYFDAHFNKPQEESTSQSLTLSLNPNFNNINKDESIEIKLMNLNDRENWESPSLFTRY